MIFPGFELTPALITGAISAGVNLTNLYSKFSQTNSFVILSDKLKSVRAVEPSKIPTDAGGRERMICQLLEDGEFIIAGLKQKLLSRFLYTLGIILVGSIAVSVDFSGAEEVRGVELHDLGIFFVQLLVSFVSNSRVMLRDVEKKFLSNLSVLRTRFYKLYVRAAMYEFNEQMKHLNFLDDDDEDDVRERDEIKKLILQSCHPRAAALLGKAEETDEPV